MRTLEYGKEHEKTLLFLPCTAEPEWAFADSVGLLSQDYHVIQIVYDGHGETGEDFISVETTVGEVTDWLQARGITRLNAAYGCSLGGACLTRFLALGKIPVERAVIDAGITPYRMPLILRRLACLRDDLGFRLIAKSRKVLETVYPPERWAMPGRDPVKEYDALAAYLKKEEYVSCLTIPKGDDRVMRYLKGETLSFSEEECQGKKGWVLVCLDDFPLGWGKINNGTLKNKYYAGWRMV